MLLLDMPPIVEYPYHYVKTPGEEIVKLNEIARYNEYLGFVHQLALTDRSSRVGQRVGIAAASLWAMGEAISGRFDPLDKAPKVNFTTDEISGVIVRRFKVKIEPPKTTRHQTMGIDRRVKASIREDADRAGVRLG